MQTHIEAKHYPLGALVGCQEESGVWRVDTISVYVDDRGTRVFYTIRKNGIAIHRPHHHLMLWPTAKAPESAHYFVD